MKEGEIHINRRRTDYVLPWWCPYCDEITGFSAQEWYDDVVCTRCHRMFPPHTFPKGIDILTGELK